MREILNSNPITLVEAKAAARRVETIDKENERMWNRTIAPVPTFIPPQYLPLTWDNPMLKDTLHGQGGTQFTIKFHH